MLKCANMCFCSIYSNESSMQDQYLWWGMLASKLFGVITVHMTALLSQVLRMENSTHTTKKRMNWCCVQFCSNIDIKVNIYLPQRQVQDALAFRTHKYILMCLV